MAKLSTEMKSTKNDRCFKSLDKTLEVIIKLMQDLVKNY